MLGKVSLNHIQAEYKNEQTSQPHTKIFLLGFSFAAGSDCSMDAEEGCRLGLLPFLGSSEPVANTQCVVTEESLLKSPTHRALHNEAMVPLSLGELRIHSFLG